MGLLTRRMHIQMSRVSRPNFLKIRRERDRKKKREKIFQAFDFARSIKFPVKGILFSIA